MAIMLDAHTSLEPDRAQLEIFVDAIFRHAHNGFVSLRAFYEGESKIFRCTPTPMAGGFQFLVDATEDDARRAANNPKPVVFCPPLALFANKDRAREQDIVAGLALSAECDQNAASARAELERLLGSATVVVRSGGRWKNPNSGADEDKLHLHWRLAKPASGAEQLAKLKQARGLIAQIVGADTSNVPICHPIRWPGSWHRKGEPRLCEIIEADPDREIDLDAALAVLGALGREERSDQKTEPAATDTDRLDWTSAFRKIISGRNYHPTLVPLAASCAAHRIPRQTADKLLRALLASSAPSDPERERRRQSELSKLPETVASAYLKFGAPEAADPFDPWERYIVPSFPLDILPPIARTFVSEQSAVIGCDTSGFAMAVLAALSGALHHDFALKMMRNGTWYERPRLWVLLIADPSQRKTPITRAATRPLVDYEAHLQEKYQEELRQFEAEAKKPEGAQAREPTPPPRYVVRDTTVEKLGEILARSSKGVLVMSDEISGWLGSMERYANSSGRSDRAFWLQAYDGGPHSIDRIRRGEIFVKNLSVSLLGGIQPARLAELQGLTSDGLLQRFLPVMMKSSIFPRDQASEVENYSKLVHELIFAKSARLIMTDPALAVMEDLRRHLFNIEQASGGLAVGFQSFVGKLSGLVGSLSLILHMAHDPQYGATQRVDETTVERVRRLVIDFVLPHAFEFYRTTEAATDGDRLRRIASWILTSRKIRILASDLTANVAICRGLSLMELHQRLSPLVAAGWLLPDDKTPSCRAWHVAPLVHQLFAERAKEEDARKAAVADLMGSPRKSGETTLG